LVRGALESGFVNALRAATNGGWALGTARFAKQIEETTPPTCGARVCPAVRRSNSGERRQLALL
jgi:hypothetical protein